MKRLIVILSVFLVVFSSCQDDDDLLTFDETGTVLDYAGAGDCGFVIVLDNGNKILPLYYPDGFTFAQGQRVLVTYSELNNVSIGCEQGVPCEISYVEELSCSPYVDLYFENYDSLARDPVHLHDAYMDGNCLYFKVSYSGGCQDHTIDLARMHPWTASSSTVPTFEIRHNANDDLCEAWFTREFRFDLSDLKAEGKTEFVLTAKLLNDEVYNKIFQLD
ncbi:NigD-like N-terminal domain-containing protein [Draconibacterium sp. IB214405]|uniref:NigD1/NigD2 family lipoprotein n=1 Tax=Draconibacterium sp. IB214405 TaxID=3097352 RepID=UPI002A0D034C|nr:NigD-like N-terminal domain-containing protein [Draconibacterium sp. IB214405]MDX8340801.1 NigD-like N-terminal domain-containing protein [Draconibacterium sp. IB214405]